MRIHINLILFSLLFLLVQSTIVYNVEEERPRLEVRFNVNNFQLTFNWSYSGINPDKYRHLILSSIDSGNTYNYVIKKSIEFVQVAQADSVIVKDLNECHRKCVTDLTCLAYYFNQTTFECAVQNKSDESKELCPRGGICHEVPPLNTGYLNTNEFLLNRNYSFRVVVFDQQYYSIYSNTVPVSTTIDLEVRRLNRFVESSEGAIECRIKNYPNLVVSEYNWYRNGVRIDPTKPMMNVTFEANRITFNNLKVNTDDGVYKCEAIIDRVNQAVESNSLNLLIEHAPKIQLDPNQPVLRYNLSEFLKIDCTVNSYPLVENEWRFNNQVLRNTTVTVIDDYRRSNNLVLPYLRRENAGQYSCCFNQTCSSVTIIVQDLPSRPNILNATYFEKDEKMELYWAIDDRGDADLSELLFEWAEDYEFKNRRNLTRLANFSQGKDSGLAIFYVEKDNNTLPFQTGSVIRIKFANILGYSDASRESELKVVRFFEEPDIPGSRIILLVLLVSIISCSFVFILIVRDKRQREQMQQFEMEEVEFRNRLRQVTDDGFYRRQSNDSYNRIMYGRRHDSTSSSSSSSSSDQNGDDYDDLEEIKVINKDHIKMVKLEPRTRTESKATPVFPQKHPKETHDTFLKASSIGELLRGWNDALSGEKLNAEFKKEFESIKNPEYLKSNEAEEEYNLSKSKHSIYPYDFNRVKLTQIDDIVGSDFVNASYIEDTNRDKKFIAAQSPVKSTVEDYLRMICEKNIKSVVLLCKTDSHVFWNDHKPLQLGQYEVSSRLVESKTIYSIRELKIRAEEVEKTATLYYYTGWPEHHGVPIETSYFVDLMTRVEINTSRSDYPILVSCNNGVGATGVFIVLSILNELLANKQEINLKKILSSLRMQRAYLVSTWEQYKFIVYALLYQHLVGKTSIETSMATIKLNKLGFMSKSDNKSLMEIEYEKLNRLYEGEKSKTVFSNYPDLFQSKTFVPYDDYLITVNSASEEPRERYIDAVSFQPPQSDIKFILAADPTETNLVQFFRMIFLRKPSIIVAQSEELYLPKLNKSLKYRGYKVTNIQNRIENDVSLHTLEFVNQEDKEKLVIDYVDNTTNWSNTTNDADPLDRELFVKTIDTFLGLRRDENGQLNAIIQSKVGGDRSAVFACTAVLFQTMNSYEEFDVFKVVRQIRKVKTNLISKFDKYKLLYDICKLKIDMIKSAEAKRDAEEKLEEETLIN